jgi:8-oxo-dGTP pyrophosphatase MutT (NUDIX family)
MKKYGGVLLICEKTGNFLLLKRSKFSNYPKTWSMVSGGIEEGERPVEGIKRELKEETQIDPTNVRFEYFETQHDLGYSFYFYLGYCDKEYVCVLDGENDDWGWFNMDNLPEPLFPLLYSSLVRIF